ncbi:MAG: tRNA pseudouridine(38-40) synthase TruA [Actinomycetota bacterium]|nr:tRNA pseudouridine(38-40) synthase TruA [Actinomycetota bacterium]
MRVRLDLAYDGTDFSGWAVQPGLRTVEGDLMAALAQVLRLAEPPRLVVAGRTDAGVHARGQVAHVELPPAALADAPGRSDRDPLAALRHRLSGVMGPDIVVRRVSRAPAGFDARFAALRRRYAYRVCDDASRLDPLLRREVLVLRGPLDLVEMNAASAKLLGLKDFASFCRQREGATTVRTLLAYSWSREADLVVATVVADAFCHSMVRALVGVVLDVGRGRRPVEWPEQLMLAGVRDPTARVVPPHGLCLEEVTYPTDDLLAQRVSEARARRG